MKKRGDGLTLNQRSLRDGLVQLANNTGIEIRQVQISYPTEFYQQYQKFLGAIEYFVNVIEEAHKNATNSKLVFKAGEYAI